MQLVAESNQKNRADHQNKSYGDTDQDRHSHVALLFFVVIVHFFFIVVIVIGFADGYRFGFCFCGGFGIPFQVGTNVDMLRGVAVHKVGIVKFDLGVAFKFVEIGKKFRRALISVRRVFLHRPESDLLQPYGNGRIDKAGTHGVFLQLHQRNGGIVIRLKRNLAGEHFVQHNANRIDIGATIGIFALRLLGAYVMHRTDRRGLVNVFGFHMVEPGDAEIRDLDVGVGQQNDILRLDIAVHDPLVVGVLQCAQDLDHEMLRFTDIERFLTVDIFFERDALHVFHNNILEVLAETDVVYLYDIRVRQYGDRFGFVFEPHAELFVRLEFIFKDFYGNNTVVYPVVGLIHNRHTADAHDLLYFVSVADHFIQIVIHTQHPP